MSNLFEKAGRINTRKNCKFSIIQRGFVCFFLISLSPTFFTDSGLFVLGGTDERTRFVTAQDLCERGFHDIAIDMLVRLVITAREDVSVGGDDASHPYACTPRPTVLAMV